MDYKYRTGKFRSGEIKNICLLPVTRPYDSFRPDSKLFFRLSKMKLVRNFSTTKVATQRYMQLSTAFIVCYKIKHGGFNFHMQSSGEFSRLSP